MRNRIGIVLVVILVLSFSGCSLFGGADDNGSKSTSDNGEATIDEKGGEVALREDALVVFGEDDLSESVEVSVDKIGSRKFDDYIDNNDFAGSKVKLILTPEDGVDDKFEIRLAVDEGEEALKALFVDMNGGGEYIDGEVDDGMFVFEGSESGYYAVITTAYALAPEEVTEESGSSSEEESNSSSETKDDAETVDETSDNNTESADTTESLEESPEEGAEVTEEGNEDSTEMAEESTEENESEDSTSELMEGLVDDTVRTNEMLGGRVIVAYTDEVLEYKPETHTLSSLLTTPSGFSMVPGGLNPAYPVACYAADGDAAGLLTMVNISQGGYREVMVDNAKTFKLSWAPDGSMVAIATDVAFYIYKFNEQTLHKMEDGMVESMTWTSGGDALLYTIGGNTLKVKRIGGTTDTLITENGASSMIINNLNGASTKNTFYISATVGGTKKSYTYEYVSNAVINVATYEELNDAYYTDIGISKTLIALAGGSMNTDFPVILPSANPSAKWILSDGYLGAIFNGDITQNVWIGWCNEAVVASW